MSRLYRSIKVPHFLLLSESFNKKMIFQLTRKQNDLSWEEIIVINKTREKEENIKNVTATQSKHNKDQYPQAIIQK